MVQRRSLSSERDQRGHPCSQERPTKTPELSVSTSEGTWRSAGSPGGSRRKSSEADGEVSRSHEVKGQSEGARERPVRPVMGSRGPASSVATLLPALIQAAFLLPDPKPTGRRDKTRSQRDKTRSQRLIFLPQQKSTSSSVCYSTRFSCLFPPEATEKEIIYYYLILGLRLLVRRPLET